VVFVRCYAATNEWYLELDVNEQTWPFPLTAPVDGHLQQQMREVALTANNSYVEQFVEGHGLCPYAREGRRRQETACYIHFQTDEQLEPLLDLFVAIVADPKLVVAQLIFPDLKVEPQAWINFCHLLTRLGHRRVGGADVMANAALHPQLPFHASSAFSLIPLFRRAPDPTVQWVRLEQLEKLYDGRAKGSTFIDPSELMHRLTTPAQKSLYDRVAEANQITAQRLGVARLEADLYQIHVEAGAAYAEILQRR